MDIHTKTTTSDGGKLANTHRQAAISVGIMFILASVSAILAVLFYQPILTGPDYLINGAAHFG